MQSEVLNEYLIIAQELAIKFGSKLLLAIFVLLVGIWIIKRFVRFIDKLMQKKEVDESLRPFLVRLISISLYVILIIPVVSILGLATSSLLALIGSAGLAIGLALQGSLSNFAGGVLLLTLKPFEKGHFIKAGEDMGTVFAIHIFNTVLKTPDNQTVYIPNGKLAASTIVNFSQEENRRLVIDASISYEDDISKAKSIIHNLVKSDERIHEDPVPQVVVTQMADSAVILSLRAWVKNSEYWSVFFDLQEKIKTTFDSEGITIPYPQTTLHMGKEAEKLLYKK